MLLDGGQQMAGYLNTNSNAIVNLKDPQPYDSFNAATVNYTNKTISDNNALMTTNYEKYVDDHIARGASSRLNNVLRYIMYDPGLVSDEDDICGQKLTDKGDFHEFNNRVKPFKLKLDSSKGYYSSRFGVNMYIAAKSKYTVAVELWWKSNKIDHNTNDDPFDRDVPKILSWPIPSYEPLDMAVDLTDMESVCNGVMIKFLEHVEVKLNLNYTRRGDLEIKLTSPSGTETNLTHYRLSDSFFKLKELKNWVVMTLHLWGETAKGEWKLTIKNSQTQRANKGILFDWSLILHGTKDNPLDANTHLPQVPDSPHPEDQPTTPTPEAGGGGGGAVEALRRFLLSNNERLTEKLEEVKALLPDKTQRAVDLACEKGASNWLTVIPLKDMVFDLTKREFQDAVRLRYDWPIPDNPSVCVCGSLCTVDHAMICQHGGLVI
ncbi:Proprotein convertase subtilisin/kexin type 5 [Stylophora pistillata]|uniref:Proprotein convertase subtilisin/kexin type 5 n=1 Tax=Stylophora pistillata TaxID=50429 RepID=A0A2B4S8F4_STYPI|nr:Proprotein convertase subtilisin/kexin type 5 [Stylophora pistillata]